MDVHSSNPSDLIALDGDARRADEHITHKCSKYRLSGLRKSIGTFGPFDDQSIEELKSFGTGNGSERNDFGHLGQPFDSHFRLH